MQAITRHTTYLDSGLIGQSVTTIVTTLTVDEAHGYCTVFTIRFNIHSFIHSFIEDHAHWMSIAKQKKNRWKIVFLRKHN